MENMTLKIFQKGFNYSQDGPGNRLVYHMQGCNMRCPWCANPESMGAVCGTTISREIVDVYDEIMSASMMFFEGGGVTFTGGEPTLQLQPLKRLLARLKDANVNTAIETNGTSAEFAEIIPLLDIVMIDFKHYDSKALKRTTGVGNENIINNLRLLSDTRTDTIVRIPLINGFNTSAANAREFAAALGGLTSPRMRFEFLPYHEYGKVKWEQAGMEYKMTDAHVPNGTAELFWAEFEKVGLKIINT